MWLYVVICSDVVSSSGRFWENAGWVVVVWIVLEPCEETHFGFLVRVDVASRTRE